MKKARAVYLEWEDSSTPTGGGSAWASTRDAVELTAAKVRTVGFVINEDKDFITIASSYDAEEASGVMCIPKRSIMRRRIVHLP